MNSNQRWVPTAFLKSLLDIKLRQPEPPTGSASDYSSQTRCRMSCLETSSRSWLTEAMPKPSETSGLTTDPNRHERYEEELCAYLDVPSPCRRLTRRIETDMQLTVTSNCYFGKIILMASLTTDRQLAPDRWERSRFVEKVTSKR